MIGSGAPRDGKERRYTTVTWLLQVPVMMAKSADADLDFISMQALPRRYVTVIRRRNRRM